jgi:hypothetical protein
MRPSGDSASQARGLRVHPLLLLKSLAPPPPIGAHLTFASLSCVSLKSDNRPISVHQASGHAILTNVYHPSSERDELPTDRCQTLPILFCEVFSTNNVTPPDVAYSTHAFVGEDSASASTVFIYQWPFPPPGQCWASQLPRRF